MGAFAGIRYIQDVSDGDIASLTNSLASQGLIDPVENISNDNIYIFHGQADSVVPWGELKIFRSFKNISLQNRLVRSRTFTKTFLPTDPTLR